MMKKIHFNLVTNLNHPLPGILYPDPRLSLRAREYEPVKQDFQDRITRLYSTGFI